MIQDTDFYLIRDRISRWFLANRIEYNFRKQRTPYKVWISEVILQQSRINAVSKKLDTFLERFPNLETLAGATENEVLIAFKGMGYYNRARQIWRGGQVLKNHPDFFLGSQHDLLKIPSIGPYTSAAICSISFDKKIACIDGNIVRILSRLFMENVSNNRTDKTIEFFEQNLFKKTRSKPGDINEAFMEFGQQVCKVRSPDCQNCFISNLCLAYKNQKVNDFPLRSTGQFKNVAWNIYFIQYEDEILMQNLGNFHFLKNQTGFPSTLKIEENTFSSFNSKALNKVILSDKKNLTWTNSHTITNHKISFFSKLILIKEKIIFEDQTVWTNINEVEKSLVSSGLLKAWNTFYKSGISARGGT